MARRDSYEDEEEDDARDPDESDIDEDNEDGPALAECPYCRAEILDDAVRCPRCGSFISEEEAPRRKPAWILVSAVVLIVAIVIAWVLRGG